ncbi:MAG: hypothetical protein ACRDI0_09835 [Actinomycetota bacterium]
MRRWGLSVLVAVLAWGIPAVPAATVGEGDLEGLLAGAARVDSTWHVGGSAGQYAGQDCVLEDIGFPEEACLGTSVHHDHADPFTHQTRRNPSYGIQGREWVRALVVDGPSATEPGGRQRFAIVSNDLYIPQDLVNRRVAHIVADHDRAHPEAATGISPENLAVSVSHSHSSPYYSTPSWGVWLFQDVFDIRYFEHIAQKMAQAVIEASANLRPARMGAAAIPFTVDGKPPGASWLKKHSYGPVNSLGVNGNNEGAPAGYPRTDTDRDLAVLRFDDVSDPAAPKPLANWVVWGMHPENLDGNDLLASEYVNVTYRIVDRELGGITLFSQADTGTAEATDNLNAHPSHLRQEFSHKEYAQVERAARTVANTVRVAWTDVARASAGASIPRHHRVVPFSTSPPVGFKDLRFAPPGARTSPTVSSCRAERAFDGNPGIPIAGLPDCEYVLTPVESALDQFPFDPGVTYDALREAGVPVPDNVGAPSYTGLQETLQVHLQAIRLGNVGITVCPCEQWADQSRNIKSRLDTASGNLWYGWDWTANYNDPGWQPGVIYDGKDLPGHGPLTLNDWCLPNEDGTWACRNPGNPAQRVTIPDLAFRRMKAQIYNDARSWDEPASSLRAESDPADPDDIWGNFTHEELTEFAYDLVVTVGMTNDYWGYIASYREFQRGDHYRKSLTGLGPHSQDFLATRLSRMAAELNGGPEVALGPKDLAYAWDYEHQGLRARVLGQSVGTLLPLYEQQLPADGGSPGIVEQPRNITRFETAQVRWVGGSNYVDTPMVAVERCARETAGSCARWLPHADGFGEVQVRVTYPRPAQLVDWRVGAYEWPWVATFEAFDSDIVLPDVLGSRRSQTLAGLYRFVVEGCHRGSTPAPGDPTCPSHEPVNRVAPYRLTSQPFRVSPWDGITVPDVAVEPGDAVSFTVGPEYLGPDGRKFLPSYSNTDELFDYTKSNPIDYPNTYDSPFPFIQPRHDGGGSDEDDVKEYGPGPHDDEVFCFHCSFRPWADTGAVATAVVTVIRAGGAREAVAAVYDPGTERWYAPVSLAPGDAAFVDRGGIVDVFGEFNGQPSATVTGQG